MTHSAIPAPDGSVDPGVAWHYGDPLREQRWLEAGDALVDLSHRGIVTVSGPDRLSWLNDLTTALLLGLAPNDRRTALILDPHGHIEHELHLVDDGERTWIIVAPGRSAALLTYLRSMQFLLRVELADRTGDCAVVGGVGAEPAPAVLAAALAVWSQPAEFAGTGTTSAGTDRGGDASKYVPVRPADFPAFEVVVARADLEEVLASAPHRAGTWAWEALRVAAGVPRADVDADHRALPHELGWIGSAVHLAKGCYRGQEAVARTHNMGRPPRRLVLLHLDGSAEALPRSGDSVTVDGGAVGRVGSVAVHHELGPIALALVKRRTPSDVPVNAGGIDATQESIVV